MPDVSIVNTSVTSAPIDYTVPGTQELLLKAVRASIDGSGTASVWLPALQLIDPAGHVMWTAVNPSDEVAAGASADASWFPRVAGASAAATAFQIPYAGVFTTASQTIVADNAKHAVSIQDGVTGTFYTSDATIFANGHRNVGFGDQYGIECLAVGTYAIWENYFFHNGTAGTQMNSYHTVFGGNTISSWQFGRTGALLQDGWDRGQPIATTHTSFAELCNATTLNPAPIWILPYCQVAAGANPTVDVQTFVFYLGPFAGASL